MNRVVLRLPIALFVARTMPVRRAPSLMLLLRCRLAMMMLGLVVLATPAAANDLPAGEFDNWTRGQTYLEELYAFTLSVATPIGGPFDSRLEGFFMQSDGYQCANCVSNGTTVMRSFLFNLDQVNDGPNGAADFQTFYPPGLTNVTGVTFRGVGRASNFSIDNLVVESVPDNTSSLPLLACALAALAVGAKFMA